MARYIDADKLIAERTIFMQDEEAFDVSVVLVSDIKLAPTADVAEVKHGEWKRERIQSKTGNIFYSAPECSNCGEKNTFKTTYCPNCGAKMDK